MSDRLVARLARAAGASLLAVLLVVPATSAAGPTRTVTTLDDPAFDRTESTSVTSRCGFPVTADVSGRWIERVYRTGGRLVALSTYVTRITFVATRTGDVVRLRDVSTERTYLRDGARLRAVTGRSVVLYGHVGRIVVALSGNRIVFSRGSDVGRFYSTVCSRLLAAGAR